MRQPDGTYVEMDRGDELVRAFAERQLDALITVGGDASLSIGARLAERGLRVVAAHVRERTRQGRSYNIVVVAEGARPTGGSVTVQGKGGVPAREARRCGGEGGA